MTLQLYRIPRFLGINESECENNIDPGESPMARNMDTEGGRLRVADGYVHHASAAFPAPDEIRRMTVWRKNGTRRFVLFTKTGLSAFTEGGAAFSDIGSLPAGKTLDSAQEDFLPLKIGSTEMMLAASGVRGIQKWDGSAASVSDFGSEALLSNVPVRYVELYYSRLFAAGDAEHPSRLYWSAAPGDGRSVEDWSSAAASENVGGGHVEVGTDSDPITGLFALSNQLLIFKRDTLYRLLGDRPSNYRIYPVGAAMTQPVSSACVRYGDVLYFLTEKGLYYFDGQTAARAFDADKVRGILETADLSDCMAAACRDKLYFAFRENGASVNNAMLVYDLNRRTYMLRNGFTVRALCADGGTLFLMDGDGYLCRFGEGDSYAGREIEARWDTQMTDLGGKLSVKQLKELYLRGSGGVIAISAETGSGTVFYERLMPDAKTDVLEALLSGDGRAFRLSIGNVNGSRFTIDGGLELLFDVQRRVL